MRGPVLLFDLVGTLVDEESDYESLDATMEAARYRFGIQEEASALSGDFSLALMEILRTEGDAADGGKPPEWVPFEQAAKEIFAAVLEVRGIDADADDVAWFWRTFVDVQRRVVKPHADARACLEWARANGYRTWVLTDADPYFAHDIMEHVGLASLWDGIVTAREAGAPKPEPPIYRLALKRAGVTPLEAIMVGDSYERDVLGARASGVQRAVLLDRHMARTVDDVPVISSLLHLPAALATLVPSIN